MNRKKSPARSKQNAEKQSRREIIGKAVLCTLICLWMFFLGLLVGRGTAPIRFDIVRLQDELAALKAATIEETVTRYQVAFEELDREKDLGFHEALQDEETELPAAVLSSTAPPSEASPEPRSGAPEKDETSIPKKSKESEFQKPATATASGAWAIQVAATQEEAQGKKLVERLAKLGYSAYIVKASIAGILTQQSLSHYWEAAHNL